MGTLRLSGCLGGARRDRTADLLHAMQALSQLSYGPTKGREGTQGSRHCQGSAAVSAAPPPRSLASGSDCIESDPRCIDSDTDRSTAVWECKRNSAGFGRGLLVLRYPEQRGFQIRKLRG